MRFNPLVTLALGALVATACDVQEPTAPAPLGPALDLDEIGPGYRTEAPPQAELLVDGALLPLATSGEVMPGSGRKLAGILDGIGSFGGGRFMKSYVSHEISGAARVSLLTVDARHGVIVDHSYTIDGSEGYSRLCSASWQDADDGFPGGYFFTGEETADGIQLAIDRRGNIIEMPHVGYYAHEQQVSVPGFRGHVVVVNFDDDGTSGPDLSTEDAESELYMYVGRNSNQVLNGSGQLYVFASDEADDVGDLAVGRTIRGHWIPVPEAVALDRGPDPATGKPPLDGWVDDPAHDAFDFTRLEDGFYDKVAKREGDRPAVYFYDTGDPTLGTPEDGFWDKWGAIYRLEWVDRRRPAGAVDLTLLARSEGPGLGWASPDNGDMNADGVIMLQEDRAAGPWTQDEARIFMFERAPDGGLVDPAGVAVAQTVGSDCLGDSGGDCWETSGIEDASAWFGEDAWIFDVQSKRALPDCPECASDGQLLLMKIGDDFDFKDDDEDDEEDDEPGRRKGRRAR